MTETTFESFQKFKAIAETLADLKSDFELGLKWQASLETRCAEAERERDAYKKAKQENDDRFMGERDMVRRDLEDLKKESQQHYDRHVRELDALRRQLETAREDIKQQRQDDGQNGHELNAALKREDAFLKEHHDVAKALNYQTAFGTLAEWAAEVKKVAEFQNQRADKLEESLLCYMPGLCFRLNHRPTIGNFCPECSPHKSAADRITEIQKRVVLAEDCVRSANEAADKWEKRYRENFSTAMSVSKDDLDAATKEVTDLKTKLADKDKLAEEATVLVLMLFRVVMNVKAAINKPNNSTTIWNSSETHKALLELQLAINDKKAEVFYQYEQSLVTVAAAASILHQAVNKPEMEKAKNVLRTALKECGDQRARMFE